MKKLLYLLMLFTLPINVAAASCTTTEKSTLITKSNLINFNYVEVEDYYTGDEVGYPETLDEEDYADYKLYYEYFNINILNLTEEFYIKVTNNVNSEVDYIYYDDVKDGVYTFMHETLTDVTTYKFEIYSSSQTDCEDELIAIKYLLVPKYNRYSTLSICSLYSEESVCQKYTTVSTYTESYVLDKLTNSSTSSEEQSLVQETDSFFSTLKENLIYIILGGVSISVITVAIIVIRKKRSDLK